MEISNIVELITQAGFGAMAGIVLWMFYTTNKSTTEYLQSIVTSFNSSLDSVTETLIELKSTIETLKEK